MTNARYEVVRSCVLVLLDRIYAPLLHSETRACLLAHRGLEVSVAEIEEVVRFEQEAFEAGQERDVWLCPALEPPDFFPDTDYVTRSDWSLENRMVEVSAERERRIWLLRPLSDLLISQLEEGRDPTALDGLFRELVGYLPTDELAKRLGCGSDQPIQLDIHDERQIETVRELAEDQHGLLARPDRRRGLAAGAARLSGRERLFGVVEA